MLGNHSSSLESPTFHFYPNRIETQHPRNLHYRNPSQICRGQRLRLFALPPLGEKDPVIPSQVPTRERNPSSGDLDQNYVQSQLELLEKLTSAREGSQEKVTIAEQLARKIPVDRKDETIVPLVKRIPMEYDDLTISQKRNIRRQKYLDQVSKRNDVPLFVAIGLFVLLPPAIILGIAVATGYIDLPS